MATEIPIRSEAIDLDQFLKLAGVADSGGQAKHIVQGGAVKVNNQVELRRRRSLKVGDVVSVGGDEFRVGTARPA